MGGLPAALYPRSGCSLSFERSRHTASTFFFLTPQDVVWTAGVDFLSGATIDLGAWRLFGATLHVYYEWNIKCVMLSIQSITGINHFQVLKRKICIVECPDVDILRIFLSAQNTSMMNAITSSRIYCMYPDLHDDGININYMYQTPRWWERTFDVFTFGLKTHITTECWNVPCGSCCSTVTRIFRDAANNYFIWGPQTPSVVDAFSTPSYRWRLLAYDTCRNSQCPHKGRPMNLSS